MRLRFQALALELITLMKEATLETSASLSLHGGNSTLIVLFDVKFSLSHEHCTMVFLDHAQTHFKIEAEVNSEMSFFFGI